MYTIAKNIQVLFFLLAFALLVPACSSGDSPTTTDPIVDNTVKTAGIMAVSATTSTYNGVYKPHHVLAIWIESNSGAFVKTLLVNAQARKQYLTNWISNSSSNTTDATTGATLNSHGTRTCIWNGTDSKGAVVGDGVYRVCMEFTENNSTGKIATFTFTKGTTTNTQTPSAQNNFSNVNIVWTPAK